MPRIPRLAGFTQNQIAENKAQGLCACGGEARIVTETKTFETCWDCCTQYRERTIEHREKLVGEGRSKPKTFDTSPELVGLINQWARRGKVSPSRFMHRLIIEIAPLIDLAQDREMRIEDLVDRLLELDRRSNRVLSESRS